jgi:hypothetical protein
MKSTSASMPFFICASVALAAAAFVTSAHADEVINQQTPRTKGMSMNDCKQHNEMSKRHTGDRDDAMNRRDAHCTEMMRNHPHMNKSHMQRNQMHRDQMHRGQMNEDRMGGDRVGGDHMNRKPDSAGGSVMPRDGVPPDSMVK